MASIDSLGLKGLKSSITLSNTYELIGFLSSSEIAKTIPPFAVPSSLVTINPVSFVTSLNTFA